MLSNLETENIILKSKFPHQINILICKDIYNYKFTDFEELKKACREYPINISKYGDCRFWDVSNFNVLTYLFSEFNFDSHLDISTWNVSNVVNMDYLFYKSNFNGDISKCNVSSVTNMECFQCY